MTTTVLYIVLGTFLGVLQIGLGLAAGLWIRRAGPSPSPSGQEDEQRVREFLHQLKLLTGQINHDVQGHQAQLNRLSGRLRDTRQSPPTSITGIVVSIVGEMLRSNEQLQMKLASAESQLQSQASQIAAHLNQALTDELTGLPNRRALDEQLRFRVEAYRRHRVPFSLMLIDIDHFKAVNDTYGHVAGDEILCRIAGALRGSLRVPDFVARYGGEEFAAVLPCTSLEDAARAAESVRAAVGSCTAIIDDLPIRVTASVGLTSVQGGDDATAVVRRADEALYASKDGGRNCGHAHDGLHCTRVPSAAELTLESAYSRGADVPASEKALSQPPAISPELAAACSELRDFAKEPSRRS